MFSSFTELTLWQVLTRLAAFMIVTSVHGFALAGLLRLAGDLTPKYAGRVTPEPFRHISLPGLLAATLFKIGWISPMPVNADWLAHNRLRVVGCVLGSLAITLALVPLFALLRPQAVIHFSLMTAQMTLAVLDMTQELAVWFVIFNLLPLPPLTGFLLLAAVSPPLAQTVNSKPRLAEIIMMVVIATGIVGMAIGPVAKIVRAFLAD